MQHDPFDPALWLARWSAAGGGWAGPHLLRPNGDDDVLRALTAELDDDRRETLAQHLKVPTE